MSWTKDRNGTGSMRAQSRAFDPTASRHAGPGRELVLPMPDDTRERLTAFYRANDAADALSYENGDQKVRAQIWALGLKQLESGGEVYESYGVMAAAGIELPDDCHALLGDLPQDWRRVCLIDGEGTVRTASLKGKMRSVR